MLSVKGFRSFTVHPKTGWVYVVAAARKARRGFTAKLQRFESWKSAGPAVEAEIGHAGAGGKLVVSVSGGHTGLWVAALKRGAQDVTRYEEKDGTFKATVELGKRAGDAAQFFDCLAVDRFTEDVYINDDCSGMYRFNGLTGEGGNLQKVRRGFWSQDLAIGPDGYVYARTGRGYSGPFERFDRDLKPVPFKGGSHVMSDYIYSRMGAGFAEKGVAVSRDGKSYVLNMYNWASYAVFGFDENGKFIEGPHLKGFMKAYKGRGKMITSSVLGPVPQTCGGLRMDSGGNFYVGVLMFPPGYAPPKVVARDLGWEALVGSVVKFGPEGGECIWANPKLKKQAPQGAKHEVPKGAKGIWMEDKHFMLNGLGVYPEYAPFSGSASSHRAPIGRENCACRSPRFDLDWYDRLYLPNAVMNRVRIYDNAGNVILDFGSYGNFDSAGPASAVPKPEIGLGWPVGVGVSDEHIYVADMLNRRIVRVDKAYAAEKTVEMK
jgi:DNA-binding beta-propeller fold protein YncE